MEEYIHVIQCVHAKVHVYIVMCACGEGVYRRKLCEEVRQWSHGASWVDIHVVVKI